MADMPESSLSSIIVDSSVVGAAPVSSISVLTIVIDGHPACRMTLLAGSS